MTDSNVIQNNKVLFGCSFTADTNQCFRLLRLKHLPLKPMLHTHKHETFVGYSNTGLQVYGC